jgi:hypothetical protein
MVAKISSCAVLKRQISLPKHFIPLTPPTLPSFSPLAGLLLWFVAYVLMVFLPIILSYFEKPSLLIQSPSNLLYAH